MGSDGRGGRSDKQSGKTLEVTKPSSVWSRSGRCSGPSVGGTGKERVHAQNVRIVRVESVPRASFRASLRVQPRP
eukprot:9474490-Pyramimonas_sp.AAC.1